MQSVILTSATGVIFSGNAPPSTSGGILSLCANSTTLYPPSDSIFICSLRASVIASPRINSAAPRIYVPLSSKAARLHFFALEKCTTVLADHSLSGRKPSFLYLSITASAVGLLSPSAYIISQRAFS